jgi:predicted cobalt transporter CbtA
VSFFLAFVLGVVMLTAPFVMGRLPKQDWNDAEFPCLILAFFFYACVMTALVVAAGYGLRIMV